MRSYSTSAEIDSCCSVLEQDSSLGFVSNIKTTFLNFALGFKRLFKIRNQSGLKSIVKSSLFILAGSRKRMYLDSRNSRFDILPILHTSLSGVVATFLFLSNMNRRSNMHHSYYNLHSIVNL